MSTDLKTGPLSIAELFEIWKGSLDKSYSEPLLMVGDGNGLEVHSQMLAQFARVSTAIDVTTQEMFISPWSGQSNPPAMGGAEADVALTFQKTKYLNRPMILGAGLIFVEEQTTDFGDPAGVVVTTGRRYVLTQDLVFHPGEMGPYDVVAEAEKIGEGYNNPFPNTLVLIDQPGNLFNNNLASVIVTLGTMDPITKALLTSNFVLMTTPNVPDTFVPDHVGQYMVFTGGANSGRTARIVQFFGPDLTVIPAIGSKAQLEWDFALQSTLGVGTFADGDICQITTAGPVIIGWCRAVGQRTDTDGITRYTFVLLASTSSLGDGTILLSATITNAAATASVVAELVTFCQDFVNEAPVAFVGGASWRILDWPSSWGLTVTNSLSPAGGRAAWLDELGHERALDRAPGELDALYQPRVANIADVVTPNAIRRALSKALGAMPWCFREVGTEIFQGMFYDGDLEAVGTLTNPIAAGNNDAWDTDCFLFIGVQVGVFSAIPAASYNEPVVLEDPAHVRTFMRGYFGRLLGGNLIMIREDGRLPDPTYPFAGLRVRGLVSGATFALTAPGAMPGTNVDRRFREWLDYADFRAFFIVGVPRLDSGDFGFCYDEGRANAFDTGFYDGFPVLAAQIYQRVYQAINTTKAGGVGFDLYIEELGCP